MNLSKPLRRTKQRITATCFYEVDDGLIVGHMWWVRVESPGRQSVTYRLQAFTPAHAVERAQKIYNRQVGNGIAVDWQPFKPEPVTSGG